MTQSASRKVKNISATEEALSDASRLLSRLCKSRKAGMRLQEIIDLTGKVASLSRSLHHHDLDQKDLKDMVIRTIMLESAKSITDRISSDEI